MVLIFGDTVLLPIALAWDISMFDQSGQGRNLSFLGSMLYVSFWISLTFWTLDLAVNLNTATYRKGTLLTSRTRILISYMTGWLTFDLLLLCFDIVYLTSESYVSVEFRLLRVTRILRLLRLLRMLKLTKVNSIIEESAANSGRQWVTVVIAIVNTTMLILVCVHILTCMWFWVYEKEENVFVAGSWVSYLHITATGTYDYIEGFDQEGECHEFSGVRWFGELSLYTEGTLHQSSLSAQSFAETFTLSGQDLAECEDRASTENPSLHSVSKESLGDSVKSAHFDLVDFKLKREKAKGLTDPGLGGWLSAMMKAGQSEPDFEQIHAVMVLLAVRGLGKSKSVLQQMPRHMRRPEKAVLFLMESQKNVVPSVGWLGPRALTFINDALAVHELFNLAQMLQGENLPGNIAQLRECIDEKGPEVFRFYILFLLGFMSGIAAGQGSRFMNGKTLC
eukprot:g1537.t1